MTGRTRTTRRRAIAVLLTVVTVLLAPSAAFAAMPASHACSTTRSSTAIVSAFAPHAGAPCRHAEPGCLTGTCPGPAVVSAVASAASIVGPVVVNKPAVDAALPAGPRSAPPTPPPNH